jgi:hypothetical protein
MDADSELEEEEAKVEVLVYARAWQEGDPLPSALIGWKKLADKYEWSNRLAYSKSVTHHNEVKSGPNAGTVPPDTITEQIWLDAHKEGRGIIHIIYRVVDGKKPVCYYRNRNRRLENVSDVNMRRWIKGEDIDAND